VDNAGRLGVYICSGCGIGEAIDTTSLAKEFKAQVHPFLCGPEGREAIRQDAADKLVIAGCSARMKTDAFASDSQRVIERVNLREHVAWCHPSRDEETQALAGDYLRMGIARARKTEPLEPPPNGISRTLLVIGGGIAGTTAALEAAGAGCEVVLVSKGGFAASLEVQYHPQIRCLPHATVTETTGQPGMFDVKVATESGEQTLRAGAIVLATGWKPYDAARLGYLGYGASPNVVTGVELESLLAEDRLVRPSDGKPVESVLFVQCAGSRDTNHLPYCSSACCMHTLRQACAIHERSATAQVFVIYKDIRTPAQDERFYRSAQDHPLNFFTRGEVSGVEPAENGKLAVTATNTLVGSSITVHVDLVVLATGMVPNAGDALHLTYRQGPDLPVLQHGFPDSHFVCFPYETRRTGIYAAGAARAPMDAAHAREDAMGAVLKAIQCVELASAGRATHPRAGDLSLPSFLLQRCTQCKRCTEECPFGSLDEDTKGTPKFNPNRCRRCGICMGACPERIVSFKNYSVDMIASMIKAIEVPEEDEESPRVVVFMCENDAYPALDVAGFRRITYDPGVRVIPLRCLGSLNIVWIADALSRGIDGVMLIGCKYGDDYQCHFAKGSEIAAQRLKNVQETLQRLQLESERLELTQLAIDEWGRVPALIDSFMERIREIGPNPYKGL
jgi:quinone-modifying oxidoreductase, subunit QmoB